MVRKPRVKRPWPGGAAGAEEWRRLAGLRLGNGSQADDLAALGLTSMPASIEDLKRAYRKAMLTAHPDRGGSDADAGKTSTAYARLLQTMKGKP